jgi:hypothetical protein
MRGEMPYGRTPTTEFQHMIRLKRLSNWLFIISISSCLVCYVHKDKDKR